MRVCVVGGGIVGLSACRALADRGHSVTLYEKHHIGTMYGSSHGRSRIVRKAYPDAFYTECMVEAYPMWSDLERISGEKLLHEVGLSYFGSEGSPSMQSMISGLQEVGVPHQVLSPKDSKKVFPELRLKQNEVNVFTPEAGWVAADLAIEAIWALAKYAGANIIEATKVGPNEIAGFDASIVAPGPWIRDFVDLDVQVTLQTITYLDMELHGPVWIEDSELLPYGFPYEPRGRGSKIALHRKGPVLEGPDDRSWSGFSEFWHQVVAVAQERFGYTKTGIRNSDTCLYTNTPDEDFRIGELAPNSYWVSACSGHGFKFGPWIGRLLANFVEGKDHPSNWPRFCR